MEEVIWVELMTRHGQVSTRFRGGGPELRIGRSYRNDIVLDDPAVAPEHLRVTRAEGGGFLVEAVDDAAAFTIGREGRNRSLIDGDTVLRIGHTQLRIRDADYAVAPVTVTHGFAAYQPWLVLAVLIVAVAGLHLLSTWLGDFTAEPRASRYLVSGARLAGATALWAALWAISSRIFSGHARFARHLAIALSGAIAFLIYDALADGLAFSFATSAIATYAFLGLWLLVGIICFVHLQAISRTRPVVKAGILVLIAAIAIAIQFTLQLDQRNFAALQPAHPLLPPAFRLTRVQSENEFFARLDTLKDKLNVDRKAAALR
jgi:hypothetical protein